MTRRLMCAAALVMMSLVAASSVSTQAPAGAASPVPSPSAQTVGTASPQGRGGRVGQYRSKVTMQMMEEWMTKYSNWGRWGKDDRMGTLNLITPAKRLQAAKLVKTGEVISLAKPIVAREGITTPHPTQFFGRAGVESAYATADDYVRERQEIEFHGLTMTHYDALCHVSWRGKLYNDLPRADVVSPKSGCSELDGTTAKQGIITRGVYIEMIGRHVTPSDVEAWEKKTGVRIQPGDALILKTKERGSDNAMGTGWDMEMMPFLKSRDIAILASDGTGDGATIPEQMLPLHAMTIVALGMPLIDHMYLDDISVAVEKSHRYEFMLVVEPLPIKFSSGSAVNPLAIF